MQLAVFGLLGLMAGRTQMLEESVFAVVGLLAELAGFLESSLPFFLLLGRLLGENESSKCFRGSSRKRCESALEVIATAISPISMRLIYDHIENC